MNGCIITPRQEVSVTDFLLLCPLLSPQLCEAGILTEVRLVFKAPGAPSMHYLSFLITVAAGEGDA